MREMSSMNIAKPKYIFILEKDDIRSTARNIKSMNPEAKPKLIKTLNAFLPS